MEKDSGDKQSLVSLTQAFIKILTNANGAEIDLPTVERVLQTSKRRLYDVINVLSGIGMVERSGKAKVRWMSGPTPGRGPASDQEERERELDQLIAKVEGEIADLQASELFQKCCWIDTTDAGLCEPDPAFTLYVLKGPPSMSITLPDEDPNDSIILCKIADPRDGQIELIGVRSAG
jgi:transcription factor E2F3